MFKLLRNGLLWYIPHTCPKLWCNPCSKCYAVGCFGAYFTHCYAGGCFGTGFTHVQSYDVTRVQIQSYAVGCLGTYFTHAQSCDVTRVQSATQWTASVHISHMSQSCDVTCSKCYGMDCFGTVFTHVQSYDITRVQSATQWTASVDTSHMAQSCDVTRVKSATEWTASVHILHACPKLWCIPEVTHVQSCDVTRVQSATEWTASVHTSTHVQSCDVTRVQSATQWIASVHTSHMSKGVRFHVFGHVTSQRHVTPCYTWYLIPCNPSRHITSQRQLYHAWRDSRRSTVEGYIQAVTSRHVRTSGAAVDKEAVTSRHVTSGRRPSRHVTSRQDVRRRRGQGGRHVTSRHDVRHPQNGPCSRVRTHENMDVSKNRGTPKWMVYNGKPY